jgi:molybdopterin-guanine dinucleotide biosynthesis protein MobB
MKRIHIIGRKNSGKTTLMVELVTELTRQGYRVGTIKHTHHDHELDTPGKDSHRHGQAGSSAVGILSKGMNAIFWPQPAEQSNHDKYGQFDAMMNACDVVLVEGDSQANAPKLEVFRADNGGQPMAMSDSAIKAVVTDDSPILDAPIWKRANVNSIVENIQLLLELEPAKN